MEIRARQRDEIVVLDICGRIDVDAAHLVEVVGQCIHDGYTDILCNMDEVDFIDYMGISVVMIAYKDVANHNGRMKFVNVPVHLKNLLSITGLDKIIEIYTSEDQALNSFKEDKVIENIRKMQLRRRFKRLPIELKVELKSKYGGTDTDKVEILNLSGIGAYIYGSDKFKLGDEVVLKMKLAPRQEEVEIEAQVVWLADKQIQHRFYPGMGVIFHHIPSETQQKLVEFIDRNVSFLPAE